MAIYKLFPTQDTTLYSSYPQDNTGLDEILEVSNTLNTNGTPGVARSLIYFNQSEILNLISNQIHTSQFETYFKLYIAYAQGISSNTILEIYPISQTWFEGNGKYLSTPSNLNGATWINSSLPSTIWTITGSDINGNSITGSYDPQYSPQGGGSWIYSGSGVDDYKVTESFYPTSNKDLNINVTTIIDKWYSGSIINNGFIVKLQNLEEFLSDPNSQPILRYYSTNTNTIYPPQLEFKWVDYTTILTGSESNILTTTPIKLSLNENPGVFYKDSINRFRINCSPLYPLRTYQTSSYFTNQYYLPTSSYYSVKDLDTNEVIIDFDNTYTQISADHISNYFDIYMNGLEPERYYAIQIKTLIDHSTLIIDDNFYFKIINP